MTVLRPYQDEAVESAFREWAAGQRSTLFVCPTGGGKSRVYCEIAQRSRPRGRILVIADREWLVTYARDNIHEHTSLKAGIEMADERVNRGALPDVVCASIQTLRRRLADFAPDAFGLIVIDEADLALAPSYRAVVDHFGAARVWGCTATPERGDGQALGTLFESVALDIDIRDLIDARYLSPVRQHTVRVLDLARVKVGPDDFDEASLDKVLREEKQLHEVVAAVLELAGDRPTLVFGATVEHARALAALFNRYRKGSATYVHGGMQRAARRRELDLFRSRKVQFLCNCALVMRGVDLPLVSCVAMARPTQSRTVYVQGIGRGFRLLPETGKTDLLVLDFADSATTHSLVNAIDVLGGREAPEVKERAREILDEEPGGDVSSALDQASVDVARDAEIRERVLAKAKLRVREVEVREPIDWDAQPLGKEPDSEIARRLGVDKSYVSMIRKRRGIAAFKSPGAVDWDAQPLGKVSDRELADRLGVSLSVVCTQRNKRGIRPAPSVSKKNIDWEKQPLGAVDDMALARELGVSHQAVLIARQRRGIPAFCKGRPARSAG